MDRFLYDNVLRHERVKNKQIVRLHVGLYTGLMKSYYNLFHTW